MITSDSNKGLGPAHPEDPGYGYPNICGMCGYPLGDDQDEATCPSGHTPEEVVGYAEWCGGGEDHLPGCQEFADMGGEANCTCGGMRCGASWATGPAHDPYGVSCDYIRHDHPKTADGKHLLHRGPAPLDDPGDLIEWTGGGYCADPLPHRIVRAPKPVHGRH